MTSQLTLFDDPEPAGRAVGCDRCKTCGKTRPPGQPGLFVEPVSQECFDCNHATLAEIFRAAQAGDQAAYSAAWERHYPGKPGRRGGRAAIPNRT